MYSLLLLIKFIKFRIHFSTIKDPETWKFISQIIYNVKKPNDGYHRSSNLVLFKFLLHTRLLTEKYTVTSMSYREVSMPLMLLLIAREIQSLLLILSLFAPDVSLDRMICLKYVIRKASQEVMWNV